MTTLDKLNLMGIRSYGPDEKDKQRVEFQSPVTLFLGQNGCGKTTIIEAVKFACTGEYPIGSKGGQGFVYDPKLAGVYETRGQVKLRVKCRNGDMVTVSKSMQATQKYSKLEFKMLDTTITRKKPGGEPVTLSGRCVDINNEMCLAMGVSRPILNYVIFCHQEDSSWPLDEPKKLKERFDAIFDATKYNKALEYMRKMRKVRDQNNKVKREEVKGIEYIKIEVDKKKKQLEESERKETEMQEMINDNENKLKPLSEKLEEVKQEESKLHAELNKYEVKRSKYKELCKFRQELLSGITEFEGTDEELQQAIEEFAKRVEEKQGEMRDLEGQVKAKIDEEKSVQKQINSEQVKLGQLQQQKKQNNNQITKRNKMLLDLANLLSVEISNVSNSEEVESAVSALDDNITEVKSNLETLSKNYESDEQTLQTEIDSLRENKVQLEQECKSKTLQLKDVKSQLQRVTRQLADADDSTNRLEVIDGKLKRNEEELTKLLESVNVEEKSKEVETETEKKDEMEKQLEKVNKEVYHLQQVTSIQTELDMNRENIIKTESEIRKIKEKHETALNNVFENEVPESDLKKGLSERQKLLTKQTKDTNRSITSKQRSVTQLESNIKHRKEKLEDLEKELKNNEDKVNALCQGKPFDEVLSQLNETLVGLQDEKGFYSSSKYMYTRFTKVLEEDSCCPVCHRNMPEQQHIADIIKEINEKISDFPNKLKQIEKDLAAKQAEHSKLIQLETVNARIIALKDVDIPKLKGEIENAEKDRQTAADELEALHTSQTVPQERLELCHGMSSDIAVLDKQLNDLKKLKKAVEDLEERMPQGTSTRGLQEALNEQKTLQTDVGELRRTIEVAKQKIDDFKNQQMNLEKMKNSLKEQQLNIQKNLQDATQLREKQKELQESCDKLTEEVKNLDGQVQPVKKQLDAALVKLKQMKNNNKHNLSVANSELQAIQKRFQDIKSIEATIQEFYTKGILEQLAESEQTIEKLVEEKAVHTKAKEETQASVDEMKTFLANQNSKQRELKDNVKLREKKKEEDELKIEVDTLNEELKNKDVKVIMSEKKSINSSINKINHETQRLEGKLSEIRRAIKDLKKDLAKEVNANVEAKYKQKLIELKLSLLAVRDMEKFELALDKSMMNFHKDQMVKINTIVKDLWRSVYQGNDCDYIEIKTDETAQTGKSAKRAYNYRVVQVKNGTEMDMRGRCSAGQRVLACLIIRIALAETFSMNCGILALDEPTTNLDKQNIDSLCNAISELVKEKKTIKSFQLLIITHDREFLEKLASVDKIEKYYTVTRDRDGKSKIIDTPVL